ncbi:MAG TPA: 4-oxalocrotonate tautomerase [Patescibacteria group bacterium]|jgi:4-oxalocrotonate tautomerase|nr:4-oxalocrotonate tautomerase [Patescibacteria group bacterium]
MPIVQIHLLKGRTIEQKRALVKRVTEAVAETVNAPPEAVEVIISEMERENFSRAGVLIADQKK